MEVVELVPSIVFFYVIVPCENYSLLIFFVQVGIEDCLHIEFEYNKSRYVCFAIFATLYYDLMAPDLLLCSIFQCCWKWESQSKHLEILCETF